MTAKPEVQELVERLRRRVPDFGRALVYKQDRPMRLVNPDGPEAADMLARLSAGPSEEDVERVKRALYDEKQSCTRYDELDPGTHTLLDRQARAALAALRSDRKG